MIGWYLPELPAEYGGRPGAESTRILGEPTGSSIRNGELADYPVHGRINFAGSSKPARQRSRARANGRVSKPGMLCRSAHAANDVPHSDSGPRDCGRTREVQLTAQTVDANPSLADVGTPVVVGLRRTAGLVLIDHNACHGNGVEDASQKLRTLQQGLHIADVIEKIRLDHRLHPQSVT
jgi:hypothetical protein